MAIVLSPLLRSESSDSYPISSYPMFARDKGDVVAFTTAVGIDGDGAAHHLSAEILAATSQPVQAAVSVERAVAAGEADRLCDTIASRITESDIVSVKVYRGDYDVIAYFDGETSPLDETVYATCEVGA